MIKCKQCGKGMSEYIQTCPNCGWRVGEPAVIIEKPSNKVLLTKAEKKRLMVMFSVLLLGLFLSITGIRQYLFIAAYIKGTRFDFLIHRLFFADNNISLVMELSFISIGIMTVGTILLTILLLKIKKEHKTS